MVFISFYFSIFLFMVVFFYSNLWGVVKIGFKLKYFLNYFIVGYLFGLSFDYIYKRKFY